MYGYAFSQLLPYRGFEFVEYEFIMNYNKDSDIGYILMIDVQYPVYLQPLHRDLLFLHEKRIINKVTKLVCSFYNKKI